MPTFFEELFGEPKGEEQKPGVPTFFEDAHAKAYREGRFVSTPPEVRLGLPPMDEWEELRGKPEGFFERLGREISSKPEAGLATRIPLVGGFLGATLSKEDRAILQDYEDLRGGRTTASLVGFGLADTLSFMADFAIGGGLATQAGKATAKAVGSRLAAGVARKVARRAIGGVARTVVQVSTGSLHRLVEDVENYRVGQDKPIVTALWKGTVSQMIEIGSEFTGAALLKGVAKGAKVVGAGKLLPESARRAAKAVQASWMKTTGQNSSEYVKMLQRGLKSGQFHGFVEEYLEERLGGALRKAALGEGTVFPDSWQGVISEGLILAIPGGTTAVVGTLDRRRVSGGLTGSAARQFAEEEPERAEEFSKGPDTRDHFNKGGFAAGGKEQRGLFMKELRKALDSPRDATQPPTEAPEPPSDGPAAQEGVETPSPATGAVREQIEPPGVLPREARVDSIVERARILVPQVADKPTNLPAPPPIAPERTPPTPAVEEQLAAAPKQDPVFEEQETGQVTEGPADSTKRYNVNVDAIGLDPRLFQFKLGVNREGVTNKLDDIDVWDIPSAGDIVLWRDPEGKLWVADGHHRLDLLRRLRREGKTDVSTMSAYIYDSAKGFTSQETRGAAALINIRQGNASPLSIAKVIRDLGLTREQLVKEGVGKASAASRHAEGIAALKDEAFSLVVDSEIDPAHAAAVGRVLADSPVDLQIQALQNIMKADPPVTTVRKAEFFARDLLEGEIVEGEKDLFGNKAKRSTANERAEVFDKLIAWLKDNKKAAAALAKRKGSFEKVGTTKVDVEAAKSQLRAANLWELAITKFANKKGPIATILNEASVDLASNPKDITRIRAEAFDKISEIDFAKSYPLFNETTMKAAAEELKDAADDKGGEGGLFDKPGAQARPSGPEATEEQDLKDLPGKDLLEIADALNLKGFKGKKKSAIIAAIRKAQQASGGASAFAETFQGDAPRAAKASTQADKMALGLPEIVELGRLLLGGKFPYVAERLRAYGGQALGVFQPGQPGKGAKIGIKATQFIGVPIETIPAKSSEDRIAEALQRIMQQHDLTEEDIRIVKEKGGVTFFRIDPEAAARTLAHEIGHLADWLPDKELSRGNILGRIASVKKFLKSYMAGFPGGPGPLTVEDKKRLRAIAKQMLRTDVEIEINVEIRDETPLTPRDILNIWNTVEGTLNEELSEFVKRLSGAEKKSIVKEALKGVVPEELKKFASVTVTTGKVKKTVPGKAAPSAEVDAKMRDLIDEEIRKRQLLSRDTIMEELKALTVWWSPFTPANDKYTKYRFKSNELYASALSVLLNNPAELRRRAPNFYDGFFAWMGSKPIVQAEYDAMQTQLRNGTAQAELVKRTRGDFAAGDRAYWNAAQRPPNTLDEVWMTFATLFMERHYAISKVAAPLRRSGKLEAPMNPQFAIEDAIYNGIVRDAYFTRVQNEVAGPLTEANLTGEDLGEYMMHLRIINERSELGNPRGWTKDRSQQRLDELLAKWGKEKMDALEKSRKAFWSIRQEFIVDRAEVSRMFDKDLMSKIADNEHYATFDIVGFIDAKNGEGFGAAIYKQIGTFKPTANPFTATLIKDAALMASMEWNSARQMTAELFLKTGDAEVAQKKWNGKSHEVVETKERGKKLMRYMRRGSIEGVYVDTRVADSFRNSSSQNIETLAWIMRGFNAPFRALYTTLSPGFQMSNIVRDYDRTTQNVSKTTWLTFWGKWLKALRPAWKSAGGQPTAEVLEMMKQGMLISVINPKGLSAEDTELERQMAKLARKPLKWREAVHNPFQAFWRGVQAAYGGFERVGQTLERTPKIAGNRFLKEKFPDMAVQERAHIVRTRVGSPPFLIRGNATWATNNLFLYSNAMIQGVKTDIEAFRDAPSEFARKLMIRMVIQRGIQFSLASGGLLALVQHLGADDDSDVVKWLKWNVRAYAGITQYNLANYACIPLSITDDGKTIFLRQPGSELERMIGGLAWNSMQALRGKKGSGLSTVLEFAGGQVPSQSPFIQLFAATYQYLTGRNPVDAFRGQNVIPKKLWDQYNARTDKYFIAWLAKRSGLQVFNPKQNIVRRFLTTSDAGLREKLEAAADVVGTKRARELGDIQEIAELLLAGKQIPEKLAATFDLDVVKNSRALRVAAGKIQARTTSALEQSLHFEQSKAKKAAIIQEAFNLGLLDDLAK